MNSNAVCELWSERVVVMFIRCVILCDRDVIEDMELNVVNM